jgi:hypothetical protein
MATFTPSFNDAYKFTITANSNRKLTLTGLTVSVGGSATNSGTLKVYRDSNS